MRRDHTGPRGEPLPARCAPRYEGTIQSARLCDGSDTRRGSRLPVAGACPRYAQPEQRALSKEVAMADRPPKPDEAEERKRASQLNNDEPSRSDEELDQELDDSFPASDPPSFTPLTSISPPSVPGGSECE